MPIAPQVRLMENLGLSVAAALLSQVFNDRSVNNAGKNHIGNSGFKLTMRAVLFSAQVNTA
ncbi:MAG: hypothetical protein H7252_01775 [Cytophaga sp.]|nr:hypothetical protein [Undibacterium sp.]